MGKRRFGISLNSSRAGDAIHLSNLKLLIDVARFPSFNAAALHFAVRPSSISKRIVDLENDLGVSIFDRSHNGISLTNAGRQLVEDLQPHFIMISDAINRAGVAGRGESGNLRIGLLTTLAGGFIRELTSGFGTAHPEININYRNAGRTDHLNSLFNRSLDVVFLTGDSDIRGLTVQRLWVERVHVALSSQHRLSKKTSIKWADIYGENFIVPISDPGPEVHDYIVRNIASYSRYPRISYHEVSLETLMHLIAMKHGITLVSEGWRWMSYPDLVLLPLIGLSDTVPMSAVWLPNNDNPALQKFINYARRMSQNQPSKAPITVPDS